MRNNGIYRSDEEYRRPCETPAPSSSLEYSPPLREEGSENIGEYSSPAREEFPEVPKEYRDVNQRTVSDKKAASETSFSEHRRRDIRKDMRRRMLMQAACVSVTVLTIATSFGRDILRADPLGYNALTNYSSSPSSAYSSSEWDESSYASGGSVKEADPQNTSAQTTGSEVNPGNTVRDGFSLIDPKRTAPDELLDTVDPFEWQLIGDSSEGSFDENDSSYSLTYLSEDCGPKAGSAVLSVEYASADGSSDTVYFVRTNKETGGLEYRYDCEGCKEPVGSIEYNEYSNTLYLTDANIYGISIVDMGADFTISLYGDNTFGCSIISQAKNHPSSITFAGNGSLTNTDYVNDTYGIYVMANGTRSGINFTGTANIYAKAKMYAVFVRNSISENPIQLVETTVTYSDGLSVGCIYDSSIGNGFGDICSACLTSDMLINNETGDPCCFIGRIKNMGSYDQAQIGKTVTLDGDGFNVFY